MTDTDRASSQEIADWIYAGDLASQMGFEGACVVQRHVQRLIREDPDKAQRWLGVFDKVLTMVCLQDHRSLN